MTPAMEAVLESLTGTSGRQSMARDNAAPTLAELQGLTSPYGQRLLRAKELMAAAASHAAGGNLVAAVRAAATAHRLEDATLVFSVEDLAIGRALADAYERAGHAPDADCALLRQVNDPAALVGYWQATQRQFPDDIDVTRVAGTMNMLEGYPGADRARGLRLLQQAYALAEGAHLVDDPRYLGLLYELAASQNLIAQSSMDHTALQASETLFNCFLTRAVPDGHRQAGEAHFKLGMLRLGMAGEGEDASASQARNVSKKMKKRAKKQQRQALLDRAATHLREGKALNARLPAFLQKHARVSMNQQCLEMIVGMAGSIDGAATPSATTPSVSTMDGPMSELVTKWRKKSAAYTTQPMSAATASLTQVNMTAVADTLKEARTGRASKALTPSTVDELFSPLKDKVYETHSLACVIVAMPCFTGSSHIIVVEDSQREPCLVAIYGADAGLVGALVIGRQLTILRPYVRLAKDGSIVVRVDEPRASVELGELHRLCWTCLTRPPAAGSALQGCARCHRALYCSKRCQKQDWQEFGHRNVCAGHRAQ